MLFFPKTPTDAQVIERELAEAKLDALRYHAKLEYAKAMTEMLTGRIRRLEQAQAAMRSLGEL